MSLKSSLLEGSGISHFSLGCGLLQMDARVPFIVIGRRSCRSSILVTALLSGFTVMLLSPYSFENFPCCQGQGKTVDL